MVYTTAGVINIGFKCKLNLLSILDESTLFLNDETAITTINITNSKAIRWYDKQKHQSNRRMLEILHRFWNFWSKYNGIQSRKQNHCLINII